MTRQELIDSLAAKITTNTNGENTAARVRDIITEVINNCVNTEQDLYTSPAEAELEIGMAGSVSADCSTRKSFYLLVTENVVLDAVNMKNGEVYTFCFEQASDTATVSLRPALVSDNFSMVTGNGNLSIVQGYCHNSIIYLFEQRNVN